MDKPRTNSSQTGGQRVGSGLSAEPGPAADVLVKSRERVADHGEVFTPAWLVEDMLALVKAETERIDSRFLEPACGSGNFLIPVLRRKLAAVQSRHGKSLFEKSHYALLAVMCIYGIELLADNAEECRLNLLDTFAGYVGVDASSEWYRAAGKVLEVNIVQGDALTMRAASGKPITFPEWSYLGRGKYQRRDFRYDLLAEKASFRPGETLGNPGRHEVFTPAKSYRPMTVKDLAG